MIGQNDNINLRVIDKKKVLLGFFGLFYVAVIVMVVILGWVYLNNLESFSKNELIPVTINDTASTIPDLPVVKGSITPPVDVAKEVISSPEKITKGKTLFETQCSSCHGAEGKGDGPAGKTLNPPPRNFHQLTGWTNGPEFPKMYKTLQEGITARGMASYSNLSPEERIDLILYIRTFSQYPSITPAEIKEVDNAYSLSKGVKQPNQIPVSKAMEIMLKENSEAKK